MEKKKRAKIASGYWHGSDCYVLSRDCGTPDVILVGGYSEEEALKVRKLFKEVGDKLFENPKDNPLAPYEDAIVYISDSAEWREQQS